MTNPWILPKFKFKLAKKLGKSTTKHEPGYVHRETTRQARKRSNSYVGNDRYSGRIFSDSLESCRVVLPCGPCCKLVFFSKAVHCDSHSTL